MAFRSFWVIRACFLDPFLSLSKSLWGIVALLLDIRAFLQKKLLELLVSVDQNEETTGSYTDEELMDAAKRRETTQEEDDDEVEEDLTIPEVISALKIVRKFSQKNNLDKEVNALRDIEKNASQRKSIIRKNCI